MKHFFFALFSFSLSALTTQAAQVTFRVNMQGQTVAASGVRVAGSFQSEAGFPADWNPATTALTDADNDQVYEVTLNLPAGVYQYKFVNGNAWAGAEIVPTACGTDDGGGNVNRQLTVGPGSLRLPAAPFGSCLPQVRLAVNLQGQAVSPAGVHVAGNFQALAGYGADWDPTTIPLSDANGDGIYEVLLSLPTPGRFQYKFVNGNAWAGAEVVPAACGTPDGSGNLNRILDATGDAPASAAALCFGACGPCGAAVPSTDYATYWWNDAVFYEIFVRSFQDSNGDGKGDFRGLISRLDYLNDGNPATTTDLGVTGIWLMPMMESPSYHGYDVTNYKATEPDYGSMADFEAFLAAAHARGIKVIIDLVLNHTSSEHPWFTQSASAATNPYRDWFRWSATNPNQNGPWGQGSVWHPRNGSYYYGIFWGGMPDLNWSNPAVKAEMWDATRFWLNKGVDGYRLDAVKYLDEDGAALENTPETLGVLAEFGQVVRAAKPDAFTVGEAWSDTPKVVPYVTNNRLNTCFEFDLTVATIDALRFNNPLGLTTKLSQVANAYPKLQYATFLANHDQNRILDALDGNQARMRQAAALYLTMPGVPFLYYGEEIGMMGQGADEEKRKPMQWTAGAQSGFSTGTPWRAVGSNYPQANVATQQTDPSSLLRHYQKLIGLRNTHEVLRKGYLLPVSTTAGGVVSYGRVFGNEATLTVANVGTAAVSKPVLSVAVSTLPAGTYQATDLYSGQPAGTLTVDEQGAFRNWSTTLPALAANQTWILGLRKAQTGTGTAAAKSGFTVALFPNPATTQVQLALTNAPAATSQAQVFDLTGRLLHTLRFSGAQQVLNTSTWAAGTYFVRLQSGQETTVQRLIVTK